MAAICLGLNVLNRLVCHIDIKMPRLRPILVLLWTKIYIKYYTLYKKIDFPATPIPVGNNVFEYV